MGFTNILQGVSSAVMLIALPQLLAADGVPEPSIASIVAIGLIPSFAAFLLAPLLDWRFSRRSYAVAFALLAALFQFAALLSLHNLPWLAALSFLSFMAVMLYFAAIGGWLAGLTQAEDQNRLGAWLTVWNVSGGGAAAAIAVPLLREVPIAVGAGMLSLLLLIPLPLFAWLPSVPADRRLASESFRDFIRAVLGLLSKPGVRWTLLLFALPAASFSLTNTLSGLGEDFGATERTVSLIGGAGTALAGVIGGLLVPPAIKRVSPQRLYLLIGSLGGVFTLCLIVLPRAPASFALAMLGENAFQAAAFAVENAIILHGIGKGNPLAATEFALLNAASSLPITYMQFVDGQAYGLGGLHGIGGLDSAYLTDALLSLAACGGLTLLLGRRALRRRAQAAA
jgi:PAT family beta-lactamase induction signal transducer AmpG